MPAATKSAKSRKRRPALPYRHPRRTREEHSHETAQDYVEIIAELIAATGEARVIDLARRLGVTHVTVARTIQRLQREGLVTSRPYRSIFLTSSGSKLSEESRTRHEIVVEFLKSLGVPALVARVGRGGDRASRQRRNAARLPQSSAPERRSGETRNRR